MSVRTFDVPYLRAGGTELLARIYQPEAPGPFPVLLDIHGGAWNSGDRLNNVVFNTALAERGILVVAVDFRLAPEHPYPAQVADQHYATRWLKVHAREFGGVPETIGAVGSSSGGHTILLSAMRPHDARYAGVPLDAARETDATLAYIVALWPVVDPLARYEFAKTDPSAGTGFGGPETLKKRSLDFFITEDAMKEANPQLILDRGERVLTPPLLILHPNHDLNVPRPMIERFVNSYRKAGGDVEVVWFTEASHAFIRKPGADTDRAVELIAAYVMRRSAGLRDRARV
jgi:acetyl esterase/lipase